MRNSVRISARTLVKVREELSEKPHSQSSLQVSRRVLTEFSEFSLRHRFLSGCAHGYLSVSRRHFLRLSPRFLIEKGTNDDNETRVIKLIRTVAFATHHAAIRYASGSTLGRQQSLSKKAWTGLSNSMHLQRLDVFGTSSNLGEDRAPTNFISFLPLFASYQMYVAGHSSPIQDILDISVLAGGRDS